jgi:uracil-DNA glycosylase
MNVKIEDSWKNALSSEFEKPYFQALTEFVRSQYVEKTVYPAPQNIFNTFNLCPVDHVKVVILGQDPYHGPGQAHGLSFSVPEGIPMPPSLKNIFAEMMNDLGVTQAPKSGDLTYLVEQGILLLNATLTVEKFRAGSHQGKGWEEFTDAAIKHLAETQENLVFLLWGSYAQKKGQFIDQSKHLVLQCPHPSPLSAYRGFFGSHHFSKTNEYLAKHGKMPIVWLPDLA